MAIFAASYQTDPVRFGKIYTEETIQLLQIVSGGVGRGPKGLGRRP